MVVWHEEGLHAGVHIHPHMRLELRGQRQQGRGLRLTAVQTPSVTACRVPARPQEIGPLLKLSAATSCSTEAGGKQQAPIACPKQTRQRLREVPLAALLMLNHALHLDTYT